MWKIALSISRTGKRNPVFQKRLPDSSIYPLFRFIPSHLFLSNSYLLSESSVIWSRSRDVGQWLAIAQGIYSRGELNRLTWIPVISPSTAYSDNELLQTVYMAWSGLRSFRGQYVTLSLSWSWRIWWRWLEAKTRQPSAFIVFRRKKEVEESQIPQEANYSAVLQAQLGTNKISIHLAGKTGLELHSGPPYCNSWALFAWPRLLCILSS